MDIGDIVTYQGVRWSVLSRDRSFGVCSLSSWDGRRINVPDGLDSGHASEVKVIHRPSTWPFVSVPMRPKSGRVTEVHRGTQQLQPFEDWAPSGMFCIGGSLFFNPALRLRPGESLILVHERGSRSRVVLTRSFGTVAHKKKRAAEPWKPHRPKTAYDRLMGKDPFED
jgi:hypothetical protein